MNSENATSGLVAPASADSSADDEEKRDKKRTPAQWQKYWGNELEQAQKRTQKFNTRGMKAVSRFLDERDLSVGERNDNWRTFRLNFYHSNIVTLKSMLCGQLPQVDVKREFADPDDDEARVAAVLLQRLLQQNIEASPDNFTETLKACLEDRLIPGLGTARVRYTHSEQSGPDGQSIPFEDAPTEYVHWKDFLWSYGRVWKEIWWVAFRAYLTREQVVERFGEKSDENLQFDYFGPTGGDSDIPHEREQQDSEPRAQIWEIWSREHRKVFWCSLGDDKLLDDKDDPLGLNGFYPCPKPMFANLTTSQVLPKADLDLAKDLYDEIDVLQTRIGIITEAVKVVGVYDQKADGVRRMLTEGIENDLIPVENWAMFAEAGGLKGGVDWFPVQDVVGVLETLVGIRDQTIQLLYEVTGMSDILRGKSEQYAGVGQEQIKEKYASIRVQNVQYDFSRFASELQTLKAEVIGKWFDPKSIARGANARFLMPPDQQFLMPAIQLVKSPELFWRVEIKPESIAMVDYAQMQGERTQYLNAISTYLQSAQAMIKQIPQATPMLISMMKWGLAGFRGADEIEGVLDATLDAAQQAVQDGTLGGQEDDGKAQQQQQLEQMKHQNAMQLQQAKSQAAMQLEQVESQNLLRQEMADAQNAQKLEQMTHQSDMQREMQDLKSALQINQAKVQGEVTVEESQSGYAMLERDVEHEQEMERITTEHALEMARMREDHANDLAEIEAKPKPTKAPTDG